MHQEQCTGYSLKGVRCRRFVSVGEFPEDVTVPRCYDHPFTMNGEIAFDAPRSPHALVYYEGAFIYHTLARY